MRLSGFILENIEPIVQEWTDFARTMTTSGEPLDTRELRIMPSRCFGPSPRTCKPINPRRNRSTNHRDRLSRKKTQPRKLMRLHD